MSSVWLSPELIDFVQSGLSIHIALSSRGQAFLVRGGGCRVHPSSRKITLFFDRRHATPMLNALAQGLPLAAVFNEPETHKTLQLKGPAFEPSGGDAADYALHLDYVVRFKQRLLHYQVDPVYTETLCAIPEHALMKTDFSPINAFDQTPGARAGQAMALRGGRP